MFVRQNDDGTTDYVLLTVCVDHYRGYATLVSHYTDSPGLDNEWDQVTVDVRTLGLSNTLVSDDNLADTFNATIWALVPLMYEDTITPELVVKAREHSTWDGGDRYYDSSDEDHDDDENDDLEEEEDDDGDHGDMCHCQICVAARRP